MDATEIWTNCKNILCIRLDNIGDVLMSSPAIDALKNSFQCKITLLASPAAGGIAPLLECIDDVIIFQAPWVSTNTITPSHSIAQLIELLKSKRFDGAVIFSTFSQNPMPAILLCYQAEIPLRLAYCRENPYQLLTHWIPEKEPYAFLKHQVIRDLDLVKKIGATTSQDRISVVLPDNAENVLQKLSHAGLDLNMPWLVLHPGVTELKREFPLERWIELARKITEELNHQVVITGTPAEGGLAQLIAQGGKNIFSTAGMFDLAEFMRVIQLTPLLISVNTAAIHVAAAVNTKVIVLYAMTNPQHTPWRVAGKVFPFDIPEGLQSKNEVLRYVRFKYFPGNVSMPSSDEIVEAARELLHSANPEVLPDLIDFKELNVRVSIN